MKVKQYQLLIGILVLIVVSLIAFMLLRGRLDSSPKITEAKCNKIAMGMTPDEVVDILGETEHKVDMSSILDKNREHWDYYSENITKDELEDEISNGMIKFAKEPESDKCTVSFTNHVVSSKSWRSYSLEFTESSSDSDVDTESRFNSGDYTDLSSTENLIKFGDDVSQNFESMDKVDAKELIKLKEADYSDLSPAEKLMKLSEGVSEAAN